MTMTTVNRIAEFCPLFTLANLGHCWWERGHVANRRSEIYTRCSAIAERPRCRVRYSFRQK